MSVYPAVPVIAARPFWGTAAAHSSVVVVANTVAIEFGALALGHGPCAKRAASAASIASTPASGLSPSGLVVDLGVNAARFSTISTHLSFASLTVRGGVPGQGGFSEEGVDEITHNPATNPTLNTILTEWYFFGEMSNSLVFSTKSFGENKKIQQIYICHYPHLDLPSIYIKRKKET
jgi:hypothetical protein